VDTIRMDLGGAGWGDVDWIGLAQDRVSSWSVKTGQSVYNLDGQGIYTCLIPGNYIHLKNFPEYNNFFEINNTKWYTLVSGVGSIHDVMSERVLSSYALLSLSAVCSYALLVRHTWKYIQHANIKFLQRHYKCLKKCMVRQQWRKHRFKSGINVFMMAVWMLMTVHTASNYQLWQMTKTSSTYTMLCKVTNKRVFRRHQQK
jgi:hypothetical protein